MYCRKTVPSLSQPLLLFIMAFHHQQLVGFHCLLRLHCLDQKNAEKESNCIFCVKFTEVESGREQTQIHCNLSYRMKTSGTKLAKFRLGCLLLVISDCFYEFF